MVKGKFQLIPALPEDIKWIGQLESDVYTREDAVPLEILTGWYNSNPNGFFIVLFKGRKAGHIDVLPLKPEAIEDLLSGKITEREIKNSDIYTPQEKQEVSDLYIESLAVDLPNNLLRAKALLTILSKFNEIAEKISAPSAINTIYAIAATNEGSRLLKHLGFNVSGNGKNRKDRHDIFSVSYKKLVEKLKQI